jgi:hypothetical protein
MKKCLLGTIIVLFMVISSLTACHMPEQSPTTTGSSPSSTVDVNKDETEQVIDDTPNVLSPTIMIDGELYYLMGEELEIDSSEESYSGRVKSIVSATEFPTHNDEANFPDVDAPYIILPEGVAVWFNGKWMLFDSIDE